jgi:hypothetical protein
VTVASATHAPDAPREAKAQTTVADAGAREDAADASKADAVEFPNASRMSAPGSTAKTIACGTTRCKAGRESCIGAMLEDYRTYHPGVRVSRQLCAANHGPGGCKVGQECCVESRDWTCVPSAWNVAPEPGEDLYACDDTSDCPAGQACCLTPSTVSGFFACTPRAGPNSECWQEICVEGDGARCPPGQICKKGECTSQNRAATCGNQRCPREEPFCVSSGGKGRCAAPAEASALEAAGKVVLACTKPADCGAGFSCCLRLRGSFCRNGCDSAAGGVLCSKDSDCPRALGDQLVCAPIEGDELPDEQLPPGTRVCSDPARRRARSKPATAPAF